MKDSKILFAIRGYQQTLENGNGESPLKEGIRIIDGRPSILKEGNWVTWDELKDLLHYDPTKREVLSNNGSGTEWNYFYNPITGSMGLCPQSRYQNVRPVYQLSANERAALNLSGDQCALQIFTSHNMFLSKISHVGIRLIDQTGLVYSVGFELPSREVKVTDQYVVGSYDAEITSLDFDEFASFKERRVTTLPLTRAQFDAALLQETTYATRPIRFNRIHQNCVKHATSVLGAAGQAVPEVRRTLREFVWDLVTETPGLGSLLNKTKNVVSAFFSFCHGIPILSSALGLATVMNNKILTVSANILIYCFGASEGSTPKPEVIEEPPGDDRSLTYFRRLIKSKRDLFKDELDLIYSPQSLVEWQLRERAAQTKIHKYQGPALYL